MYTTFNSLDRELVKILRSQFSAFLSAGGTQRRKFSEKQENENN